MSEQHEMTLPSSLELSLRTVCKASVAANRSEARKTSRSRGCSCRVCGSDTRRDPLSRPRWGEALGDRRWTGEARDKIPLWRCLGVVDRLCGVSPRRRTTVPSTVPDPVLSAAAYPYSIRWQYCQPYNTMRVTQSQIHNLALWSATLSLL